MAFDLTANAVPMPDDMAAEIERKRKEDEARKAEEAARAAAPPVPVADQIMSTAVPMPPAMEADVRAAQNPAAPKPPAAPTPNRPPAPAPTAPAKPEMATIQSTGTGSKTRSYTKATKEEIAENEKQNKLEEKAIQVAEQGRQLAKAKATADELQAAEQAHLAQKQQDALADAEAANDAEVARRQAISDAEEAKEKQMIADFGNPKNGFWQKATTTEKLAGAAALLLGFFGSGNDGVNVGAVRVREAIDEDLALSRERLQNQKAIVERSRGDVTAAKNELKFRIERLTVKSAVALEAAAAQAKARLKALGVPQAEIDANAGILELEKTAAQRRMAFAEKNREQVKEESAWSSIKQPVGPGGVGAGKDDRLKASSEDLQKVAGAASTLKQLDEAISAITTNPAAWKEVRDNNMAWKRTEAGDKVPGVKQVRALGQVFGAFNTTVDEGLKTEPAKNIYRAVAQVREALAKESGGVVTGSDREGAETLLALAAVSEPARAAQLLRQVRAKIDNGMRTIVANRQMVVPDGVLPGAASPGPGAAPAATPRPIEGTRQQLSNGAWAVYRQGRWQGEL